ncbi:tRNA pseudouridine(38-40) synthase TruA [Lutibacter sp.]|uniref:tRNA pseudouridine(38-40) synthase TruA n=1 Tax=Lutibacter sp. TaxID=1925666 RepID=UPI002736C33D|nr:tRNA pseudouridine(38-40) synthase TruA [Lutibacter sp.]MDP3314413.1 tRNA pseudouridine(38-40) synthase TruA [Lutibacter sp.]
MRYFIELAYKGSNYHGWQVQPNAITIQELVAKACTTILRNEIELTGAGRTDTGVHASQFYVHFDSDISFDPEEFTYKMNAILPKDIVIYKIFKVNSNAHARFDALSRSYEYRISLGRNPFLTDLSWQFINKELNVAKMNEAANILLNYTNFKCFSRSKTDVNTYNCTIKYAQWVYSNNLLVFKITADRFLRNMVRAIVGTLVEIGLGKTTIDEFKQIIESENRCNAGPSAPAKGLFLTEIVYPKTIFYNEY